MSARLVDFFETSWAEFVREQETELRLAGLGEEETADLTDFILRRGKRIRPLLFLSSWEAFGGKHVDEVAERHEALRKTALALELLHAFVLIHDDVIDRSRIRRGQPTLHRLIEERLGGDDDGHSARSMAVVLGDILFANSLRLMVDAAREVVSCSLLPTLFLDVVRDTGLGELRDIQMAEGDVSRVSLEDVEEMYHHKTTRYTIELPLAAGYLLAGGDLRHLSVLASFSRMIGLAFQIMNDLREIDKPVDNEDELEGDIIEAKKTWLLVKTRDLLKGADRDFFDVSLESHARDGRFVYKVRHLMEKAETHKHAAARISELISEAENLALNSRLPASFGKKLVDLIGGLRTAMFC